jgi:hypothetical protein
VDPGDDMVMGWLPDGTTLLFARDRGGSMGLWAISVKEGSAHGVPELLKAGMGVPLP